jgi:hypothetical protein
MFPLFPCPFSCFLFLSFLSLFVPYVRCFPWHVFSFFLCGRPVWEIHAGQSDETDIAALGLYERKGMFPRGRELPNLGLTPKKSHFVPHFITWLPKSQRLNPQSIAVEGLASLWDCLNLEVCLNTMNSAIERVSRLSLTVPGLIAGCLSSGATPARQRDRSIPPIWGWSILGARSSLCVVLF